MEEAIDRLIAKFNMKGCKAAPTPCVKTDLTAGKQNEDFPLRSIIGSLLYISTIARPDIAFAVARVAQFTVQPYEAVIKAAKRIVAYLRDVQKLVELSIPSEMN